MSDVWWINHNKGTYQQESNAGIIYAGLDDSSRGRENVWDVSPKDITVHSPPSCVVAIGRVETQAEERVVSFRDGPGRVADVDYYEFPDPIDFHKLATEVYVRGIPSGPIFEQNEDTYGVPPVYCCRFNHDALAVIRDLSRTWPNWTQARLPTKTQFAVDSERTGGNGTESSSPETRAYDVSRRIRDSQLARTVKEKNSYICQICGVDPIELPDGSVYAEAHHLHPLGNGGPDEEVNIVCVCPSCHVRLDYGVEKVDVESLNAESDSTVSYKHVRYHNNHVVEEAKG